MLAGFKLVAKVPLSWNKKLHSGVVVPHKLGNFNECKKGILCGSCDKLVNQREEFAAHPNESKQQARNKNGYMLPWYKESVENWDLR